MGGKLSYPRDQIPADKTFIVTGGNTGIGYQTAKSIAKLGGRVIIACRSEERAKAALERMQKEHKEEVKQDQQSQQDAAKDTPKPSTDKDTPGEANGDKDADGDVKEPTASADKEDSPSADVDDIEPLKVEFMKLDLGSLASTMEFINAYKEKGYPLHVLICNAGLGLGPYEKTDDGYELQFQVNYLSHFLITLHLLPLLRKSAPNSRIINVTSMMHSAGTFDLRNMQAEVSYDRIKFYSNSKVYQIMSMYALTRRLKDSGISVFSVHPGYVDSEFAKSGLDSKLHSFFNSASNALRLKRNVEEGAMTSLVAALDSSYDGNSGMYFKDCKPSSPSGLARNMKKQEELWDYTLDRLKDHLTEAELKDLHLPVPAGNGGISDTANDSKEGSEPAESTKEGTEPKPAESSASKPEEAAVSTQDETKSKSEETEPSKTPEETESKVDDKSESKPDEAQAGDEDKSKLEEAASQPEEGDKDQQEAESEVKEEKKEEEENGEEEEKKEEEKKEEAESEDQSQTQGGGEEIKGDEEEVQGEKDKGQEEGEGE